MICNDNNIIPPPSPGSCIVTKYRYVVERYSFRTEKISYSTQLELRDKLNGIEGEILSVDTCIAEATDTKTWVSVYYKYNC